MTPRRARQITPPNRTSLRLFVRAALLGLAAGVAAVAQACTIFVLAGPERTLFGNNEDWSNPVTRLWFEPAGADHHGAAYLGFDDGWAQGGLNTEGLAFDWVAGAKVSWEPPAHLEPVRGNPAVRMLETCATVEDAIAFFRRHREPSFASARILVADRSGASVIVGLRNGELVFDRAETSRGFGYGGRTLESRLAGSPEVTEDQAFEILHACRQEGMYPTQYANVFDLTAGTISVRGGPAAHAPVVRLSLDAELGKGAHYYDIDQLAEQVTALPRPLLAVMGRFRFDGLTPIADPTPALTARLRKALGDAIRGELDAADYTPEVFAALAPRREASRDELRQLGSIRSIALLQAQETFAGSMRLFRVEFDQATVLLHYRFTPEGVISHIANEGAERRQGE